MVDTAMAKYAVIVAAIQDRIRTGVYPPGAAIPSETDLIAEFHTSRATVVKALTILQETGWVDAHHGRGRFVRSRVPERQVPDRVAQFVSRDELAGVKVLRVGAVVAPPRVASALRLPDDTAVYARQRLVVVDGVGPIELGVSYVPVELAVGTDVASSNPIPGGLLRHLADVKGVRWDYATEQISARLPSTDEAGLLEISRREPLLRVFTTVHDTTATPLLAVDVVMPGTRHELEDQYPVT